MPITKLEAAQRQLNCAIRLLFDNDDLTSVITLSSAAFRLLYDLYPTLSQDGFRADVNKVIGRYGWDRFNKFANYLKHADKDPSAQIEPHPIYAMTTIGFAVILYHRVTDAPTAETRAWDAFMAVVEPVVFAGPPDPNAEGYADFNSAVIQYKDASHEDKMALARQLLEDSIESLRNVTAPS